MPPPTNGRANGLRNPTVHAIAVGDRREIVSAVLREAPLPERSLAGYLAGEVHGTSSPTDEQIQSAHTKLVHLHLPVLSESGLLEWDIDSRTVDTTSHPALTDSRFRHLLRLESTGLDDVLEALSHEYRRIVLTAFWEGVTDEETTVSTLERTIARSRARDGSSTTDVIDDVAVTLHHTHLPKLAALDLIEHDRQTAQVTYTGHPTLEEVFTIIYEPDEYLVDKYDGLLSGLLDSYRTVRPGRSHHAEWPDHWRQHHG